MNNCRLVVLIWLGGFVFPASAASWLTPEQVCQAAIASIEKVAVSQVKPYQQQQQTWVLNVKAAAGRLTYHCQLNGKDVKWRLAEQTRWQQSPRIEYQLSAKSLRLQHYLRQALLAEVLYQRRDFQ